jgi:hypothetical protein
VRIFVVLALLTRVAAAQPPPELAYDEPIDWRNDRALAEWSSWIRLGYGVASEARDVIARSTTPTPAQFHDIRGAGDIALGADLTLPLPTSKVRMGPWIELRPDDVVGGVELSIGGKPLDMFAYEGERTIVARAGLGLSHVTAALAYGYRCPWRLWGPYNRTTRYMIGARLVVSGSRAVADPNDWSVTFGLEFEPIGALRYVGAIKSWY